MYDLLETIEQEQYDSDMCILEAYDAYISKNLLMITESANFKSKDKSVISKIIDGLKRVFGIVKDFISKIINKIRALFKKNTNKNINNIAQQAVGSSTITESFYLEGVQKGVDYLTSHGKTPEQFSNEIYLQILNKDVIRVVIFGPSKNNPDYDSSNSLPSTSFTPSSVQSTTNDSDYSSSDTPSTSVSPKENSSKSNSKPDEKNKDLMNVNKFRTSVFDIAGILFVLSKIDLLKELYTKMSKFIAVLNNTKNGENTSELDKCHAELKEALIPFIKQRINIAEYKDVKLSDLLETQTIISKLTEESGKLAYNNYEESWFSKYISVFGDISKIFIKLQMELNTFSNKLDLDINFISPQYRGKIKDPAMLAKFVKGCIDKGIAPKYLAYNTWLIANKKMKGDKKHFNPVNGQSRFILFPEDKKIVYKIAMSGFGKAANNNEYKVTNLVKNNPEVKDYFALILNNYEDGSVVTQERVVNNLENSGMDENTKLDSLFALFDKSQDNEDIENDIAIIQREAGISTPFEITDLHSANQSIDTNRGHLVLLDYGMLRPNSDSSGVKKMNQDVYDLLKKERQMNRDYKSGKISRDIYNSWQNSMKDKIISIGDFSGLDYDDLIDIRDNLIEAENNETNQEKITELRNKLNVVRKEINKLKGHSSDGDISVNFKDASGYDSSDDIISSTSVSDYEDSSENYDDSDYSSSDTPSTSVTATPRRDYKLI